MPSRVLGFEDYMPLCSALRHVSLCYVLYAGRSLLLRALCCASTQARAGGMGLRAFALAGAIRSGEGVMLRVGVEGPHAPSNPVSPKLVFMNFFLQALLLNI